jgi:hypothetical protein
MKIRQGFVSNSSSSNFICYGFLVPKGSITREDFAIKLGHITKEELEKSKYPEDKLMDMTYDLGFRDHEEQGAPRGKTIIPVEYKRFDEGDEAILDLQVHKVRKIAETFGLSVTDLKVIGGMFAC